ncbi:phosphoglycerate kinase, partial [Candidatus Parcubacteria bacterium]|nr:phosphoglycerate kinase [Candidatus Parcubacteria bacterium]
MKIKTLKDFNFKGKKVLVRCDFNVPIQNGKILDDFRIKIALPTIKFLKKEGAKILLISHLGDPGGKRVQELSLAPIVNYLQKLLKSRVKKVNEISDKEIQWEKNEILVLENIRFWEGEEKCDMQFAKLLASFGEIFVNEAFSVAHRKHASVYLLPKLLPACIGFNFEKELKTLETFLRKIKKPLVILIGGKKIETKAPIIKRFLKIADWILVNHPIGEEIKSGNFSFKSSKKIIFPQPTENNLDLD